LFLESSSDVNTKAEVERESKETSSEPQFKDAEKAIEDDEEGYEDDDSEYEDVDDDDEEEKNELSVSNETPAKVKEIIETKEFS
jgi:hypothetical protein